MIAGCTDFRARAGNRITEDVPGLTVDLRSGLSAAEADKRVAQAYRAGYLEVLRAARRPLLADSLGKTRSALQTVHEPYLIRSGLIVRTLAGRMLVT